MVNITGNIYSLVEMPQPSPEFDKLVYFSDEESYLVNNMIDALSPTNALKAGLKKKLAVIYDSTGIEGFVDRKSNKLFKVQRIGEVEILDRNWEFENNHRKQGRDIFRMTGYANVHVRMQLSVRAKNLLIQEYPLAEKEISREGNYWILDTVVNDLAGICRYYVGLMPEIKVLEGDELLQYVKEYLNKYGSKL